MARIISKVFCWGKRLRHFERQQDGTITFWLFLSEYLQGAYNSRKNTLRWFRLVDAYKSDLIFVFIFVRIHVWLYEYIYIYIIHAVDYICYTHQPKVKILYTILAWWKSSPNGRTQNICGYLLVHMCIFSVHYTLIIYLAPPKSNIDTKHAGLENVSPCKHGYFGYLS